MAGSTEAAAAAARPRITVHTGGPGCLGTLLLFAVIVLGSLYFAARTSGFRRALAEELRARTGLLVKFGHTAIAFPYDLVADDVVATGGGAAGGEVVLKHVRVGLRPGGPVAVECEGGAVRFVRRGEGGGWDPEPLDDWASVRHPAEVAALIEDVPRWLRVEARGIDVSWRTEDSAVTRTWSNATLWLTPVALPARPGWVVEGVVARAIEDGHTQRDCRLAWLTCRGNPFLKLDEHGLAPLAPRAPPPPASLAPPPAPAAATNAAAGRGAP